MVWPGAIERYLSCGETIAAWKSIECIIGAAVSRTPGAPPALRLVRAKLMLWPTRARVGRCADLRGRGREVHRRLVIGICRRGRRFVGGDEGSGEEQRGREASF